MKNKILTVFLFFLLLSPAFCSEGFAKLEKKFTKEVEKELKSPEPDIQKIEQLYRRLHDLRGHETMKELWRSSGVAQQSVDILYIGSGSHIAPLVFIEEPGTIRHFSYTFTDIDKATVVEIDRFLNYTAEQKIYSELKSGFWVAAYGTERFFKVVAEFEKHIPNAEWIRSQYSFKKGETTIELELKMNVPADSPDAPVFCALKDLKKADLLITHDWDSSPQKNLGVVYSIISSLKKAEADKCPSIMMEDLRLHPYPVDLTILNPTASIASAYGHAVYLKLPDGTKTSSEGGPSLFGGGVLLKPDMKTFSAMTEDELKAVFDLLIFSGFAFNRLNADRVDGKLITAPPLLDLATDYGYRDITGASIKNKPGFLQKTVQLCIGLTNKQSPLSREITELLKTLQAAIAEELKLPPEDIMNRQNLTEDQQKFLNHVGQQELFDSIVQDIQPLVEYKKAEKKQLSVVKQTLDEFME